MNIYTYVYHREENKETYFRQKTDGTSHTDVTYTDHGDFVRTRGNRVHHCVQQFTSQRCHYSIYKQSNRIV